MRSISDYETDMREFYESSIEALRRRVSVLESENIMLKLDSEGLRPEYLAASTQRILERLAHHFTLTPKELIERELMEGVSAK